MGGPVIKGFGRGSKLLGTPTGIVYNSNVLVLSAGYTMATSMTVVSVLCMFCIRLRIEGVIRF